MSKTNKISLKLFSYAILIMAVVYGCTGSGATGPKETPTSGNIKLVADESFEPIVDSQIAVFEGLYINAHITPEYKPEKDLIADFLRDSVQTIVTSWKLSDEQLQLLKAQLIEPRTTAIAHDALALVVNKKNLDSLLTYENIQDIFQGKITNWKQLDSKSKLGDISIIFDNNKSGNIRYFREKFNLEGELSSRFYAVNSNPEVIDYVNKTPNSLGIVSVNWISDHEDSLALSFIDKIRVLAISMPYLNEEYYYPLQGSIYDSSYPFTREINMITRETFAGLGSGFIAFVASEPGQRIVLKAGLLPATMPIRRVQIKNQ